VRAVVRGGSDYGAPAGLRHTPHSGDRRGLSRQPRCSRRAGQSPRWGAARPRGVTRVPRGSPCDGGDRRDRTPPRRLRQVKAVRALGRRLSDSQPWHPCGHFHQPRKRGCAAGGGSADHSDPHFLQRRTPRRSSRISIPTFFSSASLQ